MIYIIDTNIFIYSIYDNSCNKAILKFLNDENRGPIPCYLHNEIVNKITTLFWLFKNILEKLNKNEIIDNITEIDELKKDFLNIYDIFFKQKHDKKYIQKIIDVKIDYTNSLLSWLDEIKYYPNDEQEEKGILNKYEDNRVRLLKFPELHNADIKIVMIFHHYCSKKVMEKGRLATEDKKLLSRKNDIENEFGFISLINIMDFINE